jgi:3-methyladenine DNA glycosylase/8-oxoguanine DNA glycosylase
MKKYSIPAPKNFNLHRTINSHGWYELPPFSANEELTELCTILILPTTKHFVTRIVQNNSRVILFIDTDIHFSPQEISSIKKSVRSMLRMDESLDEFYTLCRKEKLLTWVPHLKAGRLLRSPTVFEDVIKMICTTNCSWALTKIIVHNLTTKLGHKIGKDIYSFPTPQAIAAKSEKWIRKEISCGYRAPFLLELCRRISDQELEIESLRTSEASTEELYRKLRSIKGIGHYAAGNLLKLLGRYDYLGIDSWMRKRFSELHKNGRKVPDAVIEKHYNRYGSWRGLVAWMESTIDWHQ